MINSKQRAFLRGKANDLQTIFQIGKGDIGDNLVTQVSDALRVRELVKIHVLENSMLSVKEAAAAMAEATDSDVVSVVGNRFVLYRQSKDLPKDRRIVLP